MHPSQSRGALALCLVVALALASTPALAQDTQELRDASPCVQRVRYWYGQGAYNVRLRLRRILNDIEGEPRRPCVPPFVLAPFVHRQQQRLSRE